ncbi:Non-canonical non-ribosomal peptide synthetase FUB8 [Hypsizygus marmoreus]|uniref:Non-canonical non-ribosomal peptide synthetase FUB8 n=1 Tax=Hypsizygus marmoreus TaxID=39966 RepID=A0A369JG66_HYPMA|nr:Non-canonical non-ribosomal peptide synthetase FUB8 [Hypsizygus marmoreus]
MTSASPIFPPLEKNLTIPEAIDFNLQHNAGQPFFTFSDQETSEGVTVITHLEFGRAAHRIAHMLRPGRSGSDGQVVAFIALADTILYQAITAGLIVAGLVPFPISPRNSPAAVVNLLQKTSCHRLIATQVTLKPLIDGVNAHIAAEDPDFTLLIEEIPSLTTSYPKLGREKSEDTFQPYPPPTSHPSVNDVSMYLHSSGSTGFPKAIPQTHLALVHWASYPGVTDFRDYESRLNMACMALPPFHTLGVYLQLLNPMYGIVSVALYPPTATSKDLLPVTPSPQNILEHTRMTRADIIVVIPALLQIWSMSQEDVDFLKTLKFIVYSGGSLAPKLGDHLTESGVQVRPVYGGTEFGAPSRVFPRKGDEKDWQYMEFHDRANVRWVSQRDGTFECQLLTWEKHQVMVENLPDIKGYATSDLWENHPTKKYLWRIVGRIDDVIVHSSGEKTVPAPMEDVVMSSPLVQGTVMFGRERNEAGILIEPKPGHAIDVSDHKQLAALRNKLWPIVEEANKNAPAFSRIYKEMILITAKDKPLPRTGKGTVMRKAALAAYDDEIKALYATIEENTKPENIDPPASWGAADVEEWLIQQAMDLTSSSHISPSIDLFEQGFDSLSATFLRHRIVGALRSSNDPATQKAEQNLEQNSVYTYPVIKDLAAHIARLTSNADGLPNKAEGKVRIEEMIKKYTAGLSGPIEVSSRAPDGKCPPVVLLTGSSGNLGSQILATLLEDDRIEKIYAFNRPSTGAPTILERHLERFKDRGLDVGLLDSKKLVFLSGDTTQPDLGLDRGQYGMICRTVGIIIHNAWKLDFNLSLPSFESHIQGTRNLINIARSGENASTRRFLFTSSIASAQSWSRAKGPYPEEVVEDASIAVGGGYGEGKYVAERVLAQSGLHATSFRIGQVSGGRPRGAWATSDWLPILVKSGLTLGVLPQAEGVVSWVPMDVVAKSIVDVALADETASIGLNLVHPHPVEWNSVIVNMKTAVKDVLNKDLGVVSFHDWFASLEGRAANATAQDMASLPAIKLLQFFRGLAQANDEDVKLETKGEETGGLPTFSTDKMREISATIRDIDQLKADDARAWVGYWHDAGFLG